jgi:hypothetical protein
MNVPPLSAMPALPRSERSVHYLLERAGSLNDICALGTSHIVTKRIRLRERRAVAGAMGTGRTHASSTATGANPIQTRPPWRHPPKRTRGGFGNDQIGQRRPAGGDHRAPGTRRRTT